MLPAVVSALISYLITLVCQALHTANSSAPSTTEKKGRMEGGEKEEPSWTPVMNDRCRCVLSLILSRVPVPHHLTTKKSLATAGRQGHCLSLLLFTGFSYRQF